MFMVSRILTQAVQKMEEHTRKLKLLLQRNESLSNINAIKCSEATKDSLILDGSKLSPCKTLTARSCNVVGYKSNAVCSGEKNRLNKSSSDTDVVVAVDTQKILQSMSKGCPANVNNNENLYSALPLTEGSNLLLGFTQNERSVSLSTGISCTGASLTGHNDGLVKQFEEVHLVSGDRNVCDNGSSSLSNLKHVNSDVRKMRHSGLSQECSIAKFNPKHSVSKHTRATGLCQSHGVFTLHSWDSAVNTRPIESDEWLAFLQRTMEEVMDGDVDAMQQCNFVGVVVSPLRNPGASCRVMEYVACLLSLPFVVNDVTEEEVMKIQQVIGIYIEFI
jgi:hypothetical protein